MQPEEGVGFVLEQSLELQAKVMDSLFGGDGTVHLTNFLVWLQQVFPIFTSMPEVAARYMSRQEGTHSTTWSAAYLQCIRVMDAESNQLGRFMHEHGLAVQPHEYLHKTIAYCVTERPESWLFTRAIFERAIYKIGPVVAAALAQRYGLQTPPAWLTPHLIWEGGTNRDDDYVERLLKRFREAQNQMRGEPLVLEASVASTSAAICTLPRKQAA